MQIVEIFNSMQGEGVWMGTMCTFIRTKGCNLACPFCDEHHKYSQAVDMSIQDILNKCTQYHVVITGGEPTIQDMLPDLVRALQAHGHYVHFETNGTNEIPDFYRRPGWVTASPKGPAYICNIKDADEIKLVVSEDLTIEQALSLSYISKNCWLQPCDGPWIEESKARILEWIEKYPHNFRAGIQLHKWYGAV